MRTLLYFLWMIMSSSLFAESSSQERKTIHLLHKLGHKACPDGVENATSNRFTNLRLLKKQEIPQALKISYNSTFELFKKNKSHCHWNNSQFRELMGHLDRQAKSNFVPVMSSALGALHLETLVEDFKQLDQFVTQQNFSCCAWETVRQEILFVMDCFSKLTRRKHN